MHERQTVITRKGQVTIPAEFRRALGLKRGDKIAVVLDDDQVVLRRIGSVTERTAGMFKTDRPSLSAEELRAAAADAIAESVQERMGG